MTIALSSTRSVHGVTLTPAGKDAWMAACALCVHKRLERPMHFSGPGELFAGGSLRATEDGIGEARTAAGLWHLWASRGDEVDVVLTLPSERYVAAVLNAEAAADDPVESLRALAIVTRTYALNGRHYSAPPGHLAADLCDSTQCQAMRLGPVPRAIEDAVRSTVGETLWFRSGRAEAFFSQSCGGTTEDAGEVWPGLGSLPYLHSHADPYCIRRDRAVWHAEVTLAEMTAVGRAEGWHLPDKITGARVSSRSASHRALRVALRGEDGRESVVAASALRFAIGRALGWNRIRSDAYALGVRNGSLIFDGRGHGHGVGLCQAGATQMATEGKDARAILAFYFPGTQIRITQRDAGWREARVDTITLRAASTLTAKQMAEVRQAWGEAIRSFPPRVPVAPEITFAPTTEVFRQLAAQPGWTLASTQGNRIVLQPEAVFRSRSVSMARTLRHEMLHVLVETEATERAPLWLREGLVEVLADEASPAVSMPDAQLEAALAHPASLAFSQRAHRAAAAKVRAAIARYGASAVRGWLSSGPPAEMTPSGE